MKRMIDDKLIKQVSELLDEMCDSDANPTTFRNGIHLENVQDLTISDLGALFPQASTGKFLKWGSTGVLENAEVSGGTQLYRHSIVIDTNELTIISLDNTPITTLAGLILLFNSANYISGKINDCFMVSMYEDSGAYYACYFEEEGAATSLLEVAPTDTVVAL